MEYEEARGILRNWMGCAKTNELCACKESCDGCEFDFDSDKCEDAIETAIEALEKQSPKKPIKKKFNIGVHFLRIYEYYTCPICGGLVEVEDNEGYMTEFYPSCACGQRIDWKSVPEVELCEMKWLDEFEEVE